MQKLLLNIIKFYQQTAFFHSYVFRVLFLSDRVCRFTPSCSNYMYQAIQKYGSIKGLYLGFARILRCHPWNKGGIDPVK